LVQWADAKKFSQTYTLGKYVGLNKGGIVVAKSPGDTLGGFLMVRVHRGSDSNVVFKLEGAGS